MKETQHQRIVKYIKRFGSITTLEAFWDLGITKLTTRISEMRKKGMVIVGKREEVLNRYGETCHINRYFLEEKENDK